MSLDPFLPWILSVALLAVRMTMAVAISPALTAYGVPAAVRVPLTLALALLTFAHREPVPAAEGWAADPALLLAPVAAEIFTGALLGLGVHVVLAALALAGRLMDVQVGFAMGSVFDPVTRASSNVLGMLTALLGVTIFVASGALVQLVGMVSLSVDVFPLGAIPALDDPMRWLTGAGSMFALGVALAAPVAAALLLADVAIGVASRNMPQVNVWILAIPVKVGVGYLVLSLSVIGWGALLERAFTGIADQAGFAALADPAAPSRHAGAI